MESVKPVNYNVIFEPDLDKFEFVGKENIKVEVGPTKKLILNSADIIIKNCTLATNGKKLTPKIKMNPEKEEVELNLTEKINGKVEIAIEFSGIINDKLAGFYRSSYQTSDGKTKYLATTHFEPADARRFFPCWDDPGKKATFDVSVIIDKNLDAISNMPILEERDIGEKKLVIFDKTPVMSTYLVYLGVGEFEFIEDNLEKIKIRIVTVPGKKHLGNLALDYSKKFLKFYEDYFEVKYPLPKLDLIALPDFHAAAMENWGAITFRETSLLYDEKNSSIGTMQHIAETVSHELVHQWFGNLVTMKWWNDLWLNESFATFMSTKAVDKFYPKWDYWNQFLNSDTIDALSLDSLTTSHPIEVEVHTPSEASEIFDEISYQKGGNILRMVENYLGEKNFQKGLEYYISGHLYGNATTKDLWQAFEKISNKPIVEMMTGKHGWINHVGYPLIKTELNDSKITLHQKRFLLGKINNSDKSLWMVPLSIKTQSKSKTELMTTKKMEIKMEANYEWFKINSGQYGFYRVEYPNQIIEKFKDLIRKKQLSNVDRWGIQNDFFALVVAGEKSLDEYLDFIKCYSNEDEYLVISDIESVLHSIDLLSSKEKFWPEIKEHNKIFLNKVFNKLGWEPKKNEKHTNPLLRASTLLFLGRDDDKDILRVAKEKFDSFLKDRNSLHPNLRNVVYSLVAWQGDEKTYDVLLKLYRIEKNPEEKRRLLISLAGFKDHKLLSKTLDFSLSSEVRSQDTFFPIIVMAGNPYGRDLIWPWIKKNWNQLKGRYVMTVSLLGRIIETLSVIADAKKEKEIKEFFEKNPAKGTEMTVRQTLERLRINSNFLEKMRREYSK